MKLSNITGIKKFILTLIIIGVITLIALLIYREGSLPVNQASNESQIFVINPGESTNSIINNLWKDGLIRNKLVFLFIVKQRHIDKNIQAGDFRLSPSMNAFKIADQLTHGTLDIWVTLIEGLRKEEVADILAKKFQLSEEEFNSTAPEGYLFPDTYLLPTEASSSAIITTLTNTFKLKYTPDMQTKARRLGLSDQEVVTLASIVQREAGVHDAQTVASILLKRLQNDIPLQTDATVQYALGYQVNQKTWWKKNVTLDDLEIDSPYNTYQNPGLPPGPICNPGLTALEAVVNANPSTPYLFYLHDNNGQIHYAKTSAEHQQNIDKYLQ